MTLDPISIATKGYVCDGKPNPISIGTKGYVCILADFQIHPPGSPWKSKEQLRQRILQEDRLITSILVVWLQIKDDAWQHDRDD